MVFKMFVILQKYDFSSKSQQEPLERAPIERCLWYCKSTIFQANHNISSMGTLLRCDVCDTAKVRFFKQITTGEAAGLYQGVMFVILQKYDFSSKSQQVFEVAEGVGGCLWYCKSTIFQANHNSPAYVINKWSDVCDTAKVRFFKQITTKCLKVETAKWMFVILQKYDFSSKSQRAVFLRA